MQSKFKETRTRLARTFTQFEAHKTVNRYWYRQVSQTFSQRRQLV